MARIVILASVALLIATVSSATVINVAWHGGADYENIKDAISAAASGDTILVAPGTYLGEQNRNIGFLGKELTLMSTGGRQETVLDAEGQSSVFWLGSTMTSASIISGFTVQGGVAEKGAGSTFTT
jgi:hypothetical protein